MKKLTINQIRREVKLRLDHIIRILRSCKTWDQLNTVNGYRRELYRQIENIIADNEPFFRNNYFEETLRLQQYFNDEYRREYKHMKQNLKLNQ